MTIQAIGKTSYIIVITEAELKKENLSVEDFSQADAEKLYQLTMSAQLRDGMKVCLEVYTGKDELMVFVRYGEGNITVICFENFEDLLAAVRICPEMSGSELLFDGERYILVLELWDGDVIPQGVYEFGESMNVESQYIPWLREHCVKIIAGKAIETLMSVF